MNIAVVLLMLGMFMSYLTSSDLLSFIIVIIALGFVGFAYRKIWKQLSVWQILGIILLFVAVVALFSSFFYFVARPLVNLITIGWLNYLAAIGIVIIVLIPAVTILLKGIEKITNGKFPDLNIDSETSVIDYPKNEAVQQLVNDGKVIEAVKLSRELYGYSLIEAKRYVDSLIN